MYYSRQIRPPIYSMKQSKLRRRRVIRFAVLYFVMLILFLGLVVAPAILSDRGIIPDSLLTTVGDLVPDFYLLQPNNLDRDNTNGSSQTGTGMDGYTGALLTMRPSASGGGGNNDDEDNNRIKLF